MLLGTSPTTLHKSIAEKSPWQGEGSDSEIKTYFAHLAQHQIGFCGWVKTTEIINESFQSTLDFPTQSPSCTVKSLPRTRFPFSFWARTSSAKKNSRRFYWTLWFLKGWLCGGCYIYAVNVSYPSQIPVLSVLFWCLRVVGRRFCPLVEPKVWSLDWLLGAGQAGDTSHRFHFVHKVVWHPKSTTDMKDEILVRDLFLEIYMYISLHILGSGNPAAMSSSCPSHNKDIPGLMKSTTPCGRWKNHCANI